MSNTASTLDNLEVEQDQALYLLGFSPNSETTSQPNMDYATTAMLKHLGVEYVKVAGVVAWFKKSTAATSKANKGKRTFPISSG